MAFIIDKLIVRLCKPHMTELGKEMLELFEDGRWMIGEHRLVEEKSGITFWVSNGFRNFRLYDVKGLPFHDDYQKSLNYADRRVMWACFQLLRRKKMALPTDAALNMVRMYKMKGEVK